MLVSGSVISLGNPTCLKTKEVNRTLKKARKEEKEERHQEREERRREMEFVPKARFEGWDQERVDDL